MNKIEYNAMKKVAKAQLGADDAESLKYFADKVEKQSRIYKWMSIFLGILAIPLCLIFVGVPLLIAAICCYVFVYKKAVKKAQMFREFVDNDPEFVDNDPELAAS